MKIKFVETFMGVPYEGVIICLVLASIPFIFSTNIAALLLYVPLHLVCFVVCKDNPTLIRAFLEKFK